jgi:hypothetical protein
MALQIGFGGAGGCHTTVATNFDIMNSFLFFSIKPKEGQLFANFLACCIQHLLPEDMIW